MADDAIRPFPFIANDSLNIAIRLKDNDKGHHHYATVRYQIFLSVWLSCQMQIIVSF